MLRTRRSAALLNSRVVCRAQNAHVPRLRTALCLAVLFFFALATNNIFAAFGFALVRRWHYSRALIADTRLFPRCARHLSYLAAAKRQTKQNMDARVRMAACAACAAHRRQLNGAATMSNNEQSLSAASMDIWHSRFVSLLAIIILYRQPSVVSCACALATTLAYIASRGRRA